ncbi:MAG: acyltransferase [Xanthomonadaceae bacterium]|nr:acyltransferase [Xanthomonadaceae bacterium]
MNPITLIRGILSALFMAFFLLLTNIFQVLSLVVLPFSPSLFRRWNRFAVGCWAKSTVIMMKHTSGTEVLFEGDLITQGENAIVLPNHQSMVDIMMTVKLAESPGRLGDIKQFAKDIIKWFPGIGWGMFFVDGIFLKRDWNRDAGTIFKTFERLRNHKMPFWIINYPEGTRLTLKKLKSSQEYARLKGLPILSQVLLPRPKGFSATLMALRSELQAVYDMTIIYGKHTPSLWELLSGQVRSVRVHVKRYPITSLPSDEAAIQSWLIERFVEKDKRLDL